MATAHLFGVGCELAEGAFRSIILVMNKDGKYSGPITNPHRMPLLTQCLIPLSTSLELGRPGNFPPFFPDHISPFWLCAQTEQLVTSFYKKLGQYWIYKVTFSSLRAVAACGSPLLLQAMGTCTKPPAKSCNKLLCGACARNGKCVVACTVGILSIGTCNGIFLGIV